MDGSRFDALVSSWALASRRRVLGLAASVLAATLLIDHDREEASAKKCVKPGGRCRKRNGDKNQTKAKKCCGGARCDQKKCVCAGGVSSICGNVCCIPGQACPQLNGVPTCVNGPKVVGADCISFRPGECASGVCGCEFQFGFCTCRRADCLPLGGDCSAGGIAKCCEGDCVSGACAYT